MSYSLPRKQYDRIPRPSCCDKIKEYQIVRLVINYDDFGLDEENTKPYWALHGSAPDMACERLYASVREDDRVQLYAQPIPVDKCPFCTAELPEVIRNRRIKKVMKFSDGGYYCDTCGERLNCCECWMPEATFRIK